MIASSLLNLASSYVGERFAHRWDSWYVVKLPELFSFNFFSFLCSYGLEERKFKYLSKAYLKKISAVKIFATLPGLVAFVVCFDVPLMSARALHWSDS